MHASTPDRDVRPHDVSPAPAPSPIATAAAWLPPVLLAGLAGLQLTLVGTVSPQVIPELGDPGLYVLLVLGCLGASVVGAAAAGPVSRRRRGAVDLLTIGGALLAAGSLICGLAPAMWVMVVGRLITGFGVGLTLAGLPGSIAVARGEAAGLPRGDPDPASAADGAPGTGVARPWGSAILVAAFGIGFAVAPVIGLAVADALGWRVPLLLAAAAAFVATALERGTVQGGPERDRHGATSRPLAAMDLAGVALAAGGIFVAMVLVPLSPLILGGGLGDAALHAVTLACGIGAGVAASLAWIRAETPTRSAPRGLAPPPPNLVLAAGLTLLALSTAAAGPVPTLLAELAAGLGIGLSLASGGLGGSMRTAARQGGGLVGLLVAGGAFIAVLHDQLVTNLRTLVELAMPFLPPAIQPQARTLAEDVLAEIGRSVDPASLAQLGDSFARDLLARAPADVRPYVEPFLASVDTAFVAASQSALRAAYVGGAAFAAAAAALAVASTLAARRRRDDVLTIPGVQPET